ncbi:hypothetical protein [Pseudoxanthomonas dokdonensis]|uniref:Uncharacterized protein n=1 Tax=Pseudoxanthomonas dokdonensis TaxID=344882 RepID=A0A0R0CST0_9GAMM|nr:hypothetical protein [Pseudoxanthomonas dokdonensis]KRG69143.1 hypothetical protein ABB29_12120 [Pseudoxanthomonas dokdonensis]
MSKSGLKASFSRCPETCPEVDRIMSEAVEEIKRRGTERLREALTDACEELEEMESRLNEANDKISKLEDEVSDLKGAIREIENGQ